MHQQRIVRLFGDDIWINMFRTMQYITFVNIVPGSKHAVVLLYIYMYMCVYISLSKESA